MLEISNEMPATEPRMMRTASVCDACLPRFAEGLPSFPTSRSSTPSLYKQLLAPQLALVDPTVLADLEGEARTVAASVDSLLQSLSANMHSVSTSTPTTSCRGSIHAECLPRALCLDFAESGASCPCRAHCTSLNLVGRCCSWTPPKSIFWHTRVQ